MTMSIWFAILLIGVSGAVILIARWMNRRSVLKNRKPLTLLEMYQHENTCANVDYDIFVRILNLVGRAYGIDPQMLRLSDQLEMFYGLDSWRLDGGTEKLNNGIEEEFGITSFELEPETIAELIVEVERSVKLLTTSGKAKSDIC